MGVKNTFIDDWVQDGVPADRRNVQSMPHNMFAQCLSAEMAGPLVSEVESNSTAAAPVSSQVNQVTSASDSNTDEHQYALGSEVVINGLVKAPSFNVHLVSSSLGMRRPDATTFFWQCQQPVGSA